MGDERSIGGAAEVRFGDAAGGEIAVEAAAVARNRRRDTGMRTIIDSLQFKEGGEDGGGFSQHHDS